MTQVNIERNIGKGPGYLLHITDEATAQVKTFKARSPEACVAVLKDIEGVVVQEAPDEVLTAIEMEKRAAQGEGEGSSEAEVTLPPATGKKTGGKKGGKKGGEVVPLQQQAAPQAQAPQAPQATAPETVTLEMKIGELVSGNVCRMGEQTLRIVGTGPSGQVVVKNVLPDGTEKLLKKPIDPDTMITIEITPEAAAPKAKHVMPTSSKPTAEDRHPVRSNIVKFLKAALAGEVEGATSDGTTIHVPKSVVDSDPRFSDSSRRTPGDWRHISFTPAKAANEAGVETWLRKDGLHIQGKTDEAKAAIAALKK